MKFLKILALFAALSSTALTLSSCRESDTENAVEDAGESMQDATEETGDAVEDATE